MLDVEPSSPYDPPPAFALVHPYLYRSATFSAQHFRFIESLRLETILSIGPDMPSKAQQMWCSRQGVKFVHLGNRPPLPLDPQGRSWRPMSEELVKDALEFILDKDNMPCLVMDQSGIYETGMVCGCLRKLEGWTLSAILSEYASLAGSKSRSINEQFIELFDTDLINIPPPGKRVDWMRVDPAVE